MVQTVINQNDFIMMEGAVVERLRRNPSLELHPSLVNAPLIYSEAGRNALRQIYHEYISIAMEASVPFFMVTPTWRCNRDRVMQSDLSHEINRDCVEFLQSVRDSYGSYSEMIKIGGMIGCKHDCYRPDQSLSVDEALEFHQWQVDELASAGIDFLIAETLPAVEEAKGIARAMEKSGVEYLLSFCISRDGTVLDGNSLLSAVKTVDSFTGISPVGYAVNCAYPSFLQVEQQPTDLFQRFFGYMGNASSLDHEELDGAVEIHQESEIVWASDMKQLYNYGVKMLGGCCGTDAGFLQALVDMIVSAEGE